MIRCRSNVERCSHRWEFGGLQRLLFGLLSIGVLGNIGCQSQFPSPNAGTGVVAVGDKKPYSEQTADSGERFGRSANEASLPPYQAMVDEKYGNAIKAIARSAQANMTDTPGGAVLRPIPLMERLFVFGVNGPSLNVGGNPRRPAEGFMLLDHAFVTSTMQFAKFDGRTLDLRNPVQGFASFEDVQSRVQGNKNVQPALIETALPGGDFERGWMPILQARDISLPDGVTVRVLELGAWTWMANSPSNAPSDDSSGHPDTLATRAAQLDIVFVLDCTGSMLPTWAALRKYLHQIVQSIVTSPELDVRISFVAYRDRDAKSRWQVKTSDFSKDLDLLLKWLSKLSAVGGDDWEERMFEALDEGLEQLMSNGRPGAYQSIILVTDNAGHTSGEDPLLGDLGSRMIQKASDAGVIINAIRCPYHPKFKGDEARLPQQLEQLTERTRGFLLEMTESTVEDATQKLTKMCQQTHQDALEELNVDRALRQGYSPSEIMRRYQLPEAAMQWRLERLAKRFGPETYPTRLATPLGAIGVDRVWVIYDSRAIQTGVLIREDELKALLATLDMLLQKGVEDPASLAELWRTLLGTTVGEQDVPLSEALRVQGIPVRNGLLSITLPELIAMPRAQRVAWAKEVAKRFEILVKISQESKGDGHGNLIVLSEAIP